MSLDTTTQNRVNTTAGETAARRVRSKRGWDDLMERTAEKEAALEMMAGMKESHASRENLNDILARVFKEGRRVISAGVFYGDGQYTGTPNATPLLGGKKVELT